MKIVKRNRYLQLGHHSHGQFYPPRVFPRHFNQKWTNLDKETKRRFRKPNIVDMIIRHREQQVKPVFRGMLHNKRGQQYAMGPYSRKDLDFHRIR